MGYLNIPVTTSSSVTTINLATQVTGTLGVANGGTGLTSQGWTSFTPTTQGLGTITLGFAQWRRVFSNLEVLANLTVGTTTADEVRFNFPTPPALAIASFITANSVCGSWGSAAFGAASTPLLANGGLAYVTFGLQSAGTAGSTPILGTIVGSPNTISVQFSVPIQGW